MRQGVQLLSLLLAAALGAWACHHPPGVGPERSQRAAGRLLAHLGEEYWALQMRRSPVWASFLGDRRFDALLPDLTPGGVARASQTARSLRLEAQALKPSRLSGQDRLTRELLLSLLDGELQSEVCQQHLWDVNPLDGVQTLLGELPRLHGITAPGHAKALVERYRKSGDLIDQHLSNLRAGQEQGYRAAAVAVERVLEQLEGMLAGPSPEAAFAAEVVLPAQWKDAKAAEVRAKLQAAAREVVLPALERYRLFLRNEYLPSARVEVGVSHNRDGERCYQARIRAHTGLSLSPMEIHQLGREEAERNLMAMKEIALRLTGTGELAAVIAHLRDDPSQAAQSSAHLIQFAEQLLGAATARLPEAFGRLPAQQVRILAIESFREASAPAGYYYAGSEAEARAALFYLNTSRAEERLLYQLESLTFHETVPGHHLQVALAQELATLPRFRRELGDAAFVEGWAHYAELLADELGLYSGDAGRFGMLSDQALRAARLVTDTGMHHLGWSRQEALEYLLAHTAEGPEEAAREIDRYIVWPGQALAYKLGQLEILRARQEAKEQLGEAFDLPAFHDAVLANGAVPLPILRRELEQWTRSQLSRAR